MIRCISRWAKWAVNLIRGTRPRIHAPTGEQKSNFPGNRERRSDPSLPLFIWSGSRKPLKKTPNISRLFVDNLVLLLYLYYCISAIIPSQRNFLSGVTCHKGMQTSSSICAEWAEFMACGWGNPLWFTARTISLEFDHPSAETQKW